LGGSEIKNFAINITVPAGTAPGTYNFNISVIGDGTFLASQKVSITVPGVSLKPDLTIIKTTSVPNYGASGKTIPYNYTVKNIGNTNITDVNVTDITLGQTITLNSTTGSLVTPATILAPGDQVTGTYNYITSQTDVYNGSVINTENVNGTALDTSGTSIGPVNNTTTFTLGALQSPALTITKSADPGAYNDKQTVIYTYTVKNTGNVKISGITIGDNLTSTVISPLSPSTPLEPGDSAVEKMSYTTSQTDYDNGTVINNATVSGIWGICQKLSNDTTLNIPAVKGLPALTITKTPNPLSYTDKQSVTYTYLITNTGNVPLSAVNIIDNLPGLTLGSLNATTLKPGEQAVGTGSYTTTQSDYDNGSVVNTVTVYNGTTPLNQTQATINVINKTPALKLVKSANPRDDSTEGQTITYTYTVTNSGNVDISAPITVTDDKFGTISIQGSGILSPGSSAQNTYSYRITQADINNSYVTNSAFATGSFNSKPVISPSAIAIVRYEQPTKKEEHNEEEHNGEPCNEGYGSYGGAVVPVIPVPMMSGNPMYGNDPYGYGNAPYGYGNAPYGYDSEPLGPTESPNSDSNGHKAKAHLSKHKHKNHSKHHTTKHHTTKHHKAEKNC
jgi:uncharacterized repeat protein (TIGR01451 family)